MADKIHTVYRYFTGTVKTRGAIQMDSGGMRESVPYHSPGLLLYGVLLA